MVSALEPEAGSAAVKPVCASTHEAAVAHDAVSCHSSMRTARASVFCAGEPAVLSAPAKLPSPTSSTMMLPPPEGPGTSKRKGRSVGVGKEEGEVVTEVVPEREAAGETEDETEVVPEREPVGETVGESEPEDDAEPTRLALAAEEAELVAVAEELPVEDTVAVDEAVDEEEPGDEAVADEEPVALTDAVDEAVDEEELRVVRKRGVRRFSKRARARAAKACRGTRRAQRAQLTPSSSASA